MAHHNKKRKRSAYKRRKPISTGWLIPILFILAIVPLIVFARIVELTEIESAAWKNDDQQIEFFSYYKSIWFIVATVFTVLITITLRAVGKIKFIKDYKYYIPIGIYCLFVLISAFVSIDSTIALRGFIEVHQGVFVLLSYGLIIVSVYNLVSEEKHLKAIMGALIFLGTIVTFIGISQYFGFDFFKSDFGKSFILPGNLQHLAEDLSFTFGSNTIYATMYNTNYVGSFAALMVPISLVLFLYVKEPKHIVLTGIFLASMVFVAFGSNSRAGMIGLGTGIPIMIVLFRKVFIERYRRVAISIVAVLIVGLILNVASDGRLVRQIQRMNLFSEIEDVGTSRVYIEDVQMEGYTLAILTEKEDLHIEFDDGSLVFRDSDLERVTLSNIDDDRYSISDPRYEDHFRITMQGTNFTIRAYGRNIRAVITAEGFNVVGFRSEIYEEIPSPPRVELLDGYERMFSSRGHIWSRSIPMLSDSLILGQGPDAYPLVYPQHDYVGRLNGISSAIIDKPHNMFLQIGINTGVVSLVALLSAFAIYAFSSIKLYFYHNYKTLEDYLGLGVFISIASYLVTGMFNDQIISVAPIFYTLFGVGLAINHQLIKQKKTEER